MQSFEVRVIERRKKLQLNILADAESELDAIKREIALSENDLTLEKLFYSHGKAAMMSAKFYHECKLLGVPCVLDVHTQYGEVDAIIEIKSSYVIVEFKSHKAQVVKLDTQEQLERYAKHNYPVVLIYQENCFPLFISKVKRKILDNQIYIFEDNRFKKYKLSTKSVGN